ncbi:MAG: DEAD/DEAH box helicase [Gammaproteobacteria bacterium]|nr:DEAD/DEAH box helicase [Gammaproteobacteria bacterium]
MAIDEQRSRGRANVRDHSGNFSVIELREHQRNGIQTLREGFRKGYDRQLLVMPTGSGKTLTAAHIALAARDRGRLTAFIVDRIELAAQAAETMRAVGLRCSVLQGANSQMESEHEVLVGSIQTIARRGLPDPGLLIIDEAHVLHRAHADLLEGYSEVPVVGLTATPYTTGLGRCFSNIVLPATIAQLVARGFLVPAVAYGPSRPDLTGIDVRGGDYVVAQLSARLRGGAITADIVSTWQRLGDARSTLAFCADIEHARVVAESFAAAGIPADHVHGYQDLKQRRETIERFKRGEIRVLASVACLSTGFDAPIASCAVLARPTRSLTLHIQQIGRVLRPHPGKRDALILDHAGNVEMHGMPEDIAIGQLDEESKTWRARLPDSKWLEPCPHCSKMLAAHVRQCSCGFRPTRGNRIGVRDGALVRIDEMTRASLRRLFQELLGLASDLDRDRGWAEWIYREAVRQAPAKSWENLAPLAPSEETKRIARAVRLRYADERRAA